MAVTRSSWTLVLETFWRPGRAMRAAAAGAPCGAPLIVAALLAGAAATANHMAATPLGGGLVAAGVGALRAAAAVLGVYLAAATVYGLTVLLQQDRDFRFRQVLAVICYANLVMVLGEVVMTAWAAAGGDPAAWGLAWLAPPGPARAFLSAFSVFHAGGLALAALGLKAASGSAPWKAGALIVGLWAVAAFLGVAARILISVA